jgi:hypothetical protein
MGRVAPYPCGPYLILSVNTNTLLAASGFTFWVVLLFQCQRQRRCPRMISAENEVVMYSKRTFIDFKMKSLVLLSNPILRSTSLRDPWHGLCFVGTYPR